jgi:hypothetical protein
MQQRFCPCGRVIMVHYAVRGHIWKSCFWNLARYRGEKVEACPDCGRQLHINDLS